DRGGWRRMKEGSAVGIGEERAMASAATVSVPGAGGEARGEVTGSEGKSPRLGFLGVGWIGRHRLEAVVASGLAEVVAIADPAEDAASAALGVAPGAVRAAGLEEMLAVGVDGVVIATPSAQHAEQAI